ncbi:MAG TPA: hypothetical protein QF753_12705 [Victivallales bacterium]|nr:hypothetical protein [Victivallales bacterium]
MIETWLNVNEAIEATGKSEKTIRRFIDQFKSDSDIIQKDKNKVLINPEYLIKKYPFITKSSENLGKKKNTKLENEANATNDHELQTHDQTKKETLKHAELILEKQNKDIISELINQRKEKQPILRHSTFWTAIIAIIIIIAILISGYLYRNELFFTHKEKVKTLQIHNKSKTELLYSQIQSLNRQLDNQSKMHDKMTEHAKENYRQASEYANKRVEMLNKEIKVLAKEKALLEQQSITSKPATLKENK